MQGILIFTFMLLAGQVFASDNTVQQAENYFNNLTTFEAKFRQTDTAQNLIQAGKFYLQRPNKFLWQYTEPSRQKVVSTGSRMFFVDEESSQVTQLPTSFGLAAVLTSEKLDLANSKKFSFVGSSETEHTLSLSFKLPVEANIIPATATLTLSKNPLAFASMAIRSNLGQETIVEFFDVKQKQPISANFFNYVPPQEEDFLYN